MSITLRVFSPYIACIRSYAECNENCSVDGGIRAHPLRQDFYNVLYIKSDKP